MNEPMAGLMQRDALPGPMTKLTKKQKQAQKRVKSTDVKMLFLTVIIIIILLLSETLTLINLQTKRNQVKRG